MAEISVLSRPDEEQGGGVDPMTAAINHRERIKWLEWYRTLTPAQKLARLREQRRDAHGLHL